MSTNPHIFGSRGGSSASQSVVINLIILNAVVFLAQQFLPNGIGGERMAQLFGLHFWKSEHFNLYQLVTYMFLHGNWSHLFFNMFALWMFGRISEADLGAKRFLVYYFICGVGAGLCNLGVTWFEYSQLATKYAVSDPAGLQWWVNNSTTIGASGAVFGILLAFGMMHPNDRVMLLIPPIPMKAKWLVLGYGVLELFLGVTQYGATNIAHFAHVGGMLFGFLLLFYWKRSGKIYY